jgi:hypothetical protein
MAEKKKWDAALARLADAAGAARRAGYPCVILVQRVTDQDVQLATLTTATPGEKLLPPLVDVVQLAQELVAAQGGTPVDYGAAWQRWRESIMADGIAQGMHDVFSAMVNGADGPDADGAPPAAEEPEATPMSIDEAEALVAAAEGTQ